MKIETRKAFTLIEIVIGLAILSFIGMVFIFVLRNSKTQMEYGAEHFSAALLSQKVIEDCAQEVFLNPLGLEILGISENQEFSPIVNGNSIFFSTLEDNNSPWGKIEAGSDGTIDNKLPALFKQSEKYELAVTGKKLSSPTSSDYRKNLTRLEVVFEWESNGKKQRFVSSSDFSVPCTAKVAEHKIQYTTDEIEKMGALMLFDQPDSSFSALVGDNGGNYDVLFRLAKIQTGNEGFLYSKYFIETQEELVKNIDKAKGINFDSPDEATYQFVAKCASTSYEMAREAYRFIRYLQPEIKEVSGKLTSENLGNFLSENPSNVQRVTSDFKRLYSTFIWSLQVSRYFNEILCLRSMCDFQDRKKQYYNLLRLVNLYRVLLVIPAAESVNKSQYITFWSHVEDYCSGKNPALHRLAAQEISFAGNQDLMLEKNPTLGQFAEVVKCADSFANSN
ncbi:MAG: type II secretion system protein [Candidatus Riflebacteria bacterium]